MKSCIGSLGTLLAGADYAEVYFPTVELFAGLCSKLLNRSKRHTGRVLA
jgi:hypothetical protein